MRWAMLVLVLACGEGVPGDLDHLTKPCVYRAGVADVHLYDSTNSYPDIDYAFFSPVEDRDDCVSTFAQANGIGLRLNCQQGNPVIFCGMEGICEDAETGDLFRCSGTLEFE
jgi:hypothetical protein